MDCISPKRAWQNMRTGELVFQLDSRFELGPELEVRCGQCMPCRIDYAAELSLRCEHEAALHDANCFVTLTFSDEHFPTSQADWEDKVLRGVGRIRKAIAPVRIRTLGCLELGERTQRPHAHLLVFGHCFDFGFAVARNPGTGTVVYESPTLSKAWGLGHASVGEFSKHSAGYVCRYALKRITGRRGESPPTVPVVHPLTGEVIDFEPSKSFVRSRMPGIGAGWFRKYGEQAMEQGSVIERGGVRRSIPEYYKRLAKRVDPLMGSDAKAEGAVRVWKTRSERTAERLAVRNEVFEAKTKSIRKRGVL